MSRALTRRDVIAGAFPIMLANASPALVGLVDTWVIGNYAGTVSLAAIGLGAAIYGIFFWGFGFLRMSTAGLSAQADGAQDQQAVQAHLFRAVPMGFVIGLTLLALQGILLAILLPIYGAPADVESGARTYLQARLWGLPATLSSIVLMGWFIGLARPRMALYMQLILNFINAPLSVFLAAGLGWGIFGVGIASSIAEWVGLLGGLFLASLEIKRRGGFDRMAAKLETLLDIPALKKLGTANGNIFIRTIALTIGFQFFARAAAVQGTVFLAGFQILMQFITLIALVLDAFAHVAEAHVGAAYGARSEARFDRAVRLTTEFSIVFAFLCGAAVFILGPYVINFISDDPAVRDSAKYYLRFCALAPIVGFAAWQLDGIFIGITRTAAMRNAGVAALLIYLAAHYLLEPQFAGVGVWVAFLIYYISRALTMLPAWSNIKRDLRAGVS
jgi:MATE family multidrug resistance protein